MANGAGVHSNIRRTAMDKSLVQLPHEQGSIMLTMDILHHFTSRRTRNLNNRTRRLTFLIWTIKEHAYFWDLDHCYLTQKIRRIPDTPHGHSTVKQITLGQE